MKAVLVQNRDGRPVLCPDTRPGIWERVRQGATRIEDLGPLTGGGQWGHAYHLVYGSGATATVFTERQDATVATATVRPARSSRRRAAGAAAAAPPDHQPSPALPVSAPSPRTSGADPAEDRRDHHPVPAVIPTLLEAMGVVEPAPITRPADDHYRSPPECMRALASVVDLSAGMHECCAGDGLMAAAAADVLGAAAVTATTLYPPEGPRYFPVETGVDVLELQRPRRRNIVTNPPYGRLHGRKLGKAGAATRIIGHLLQLLEAAGDEAGVLCCLLDIRFRLSVGRNSPGGLLYDYPPLVIHAFADRVSMYPPVGAGPLTGGKQSFGWFVWAPPFHRPGGDTLLRATLNSRAFRRPGDADRFALPSLVSRKKAA